MFSCPPVIEKLSSGLFKEVRITNTIPVAYIEQLFPSGSNCKSNRRKEINKDHTINKKGMMLDSVELTRSKSIGWLELTGAVCMTFNLEYIERESKKLSLSRHCFFPLPLKGRIDSPLPFPVPRAILVFHDKNRGSKEMQLTFLSIC
ncbi:hypothetical protein P8452_02886 [Trifolium repens]|nr:hypothetical protein P8452_02886 [Trifolium repens]